MQKNAELYDFTQNLQGLIFQAGMKHYAETTPADQQVETPELPPIMNIRRGYAESVGWMMVQLYEFHPEPLTVNTFRVRAVYSAPRLSQALLELIASEGWADRKGEAYSLTGQGLDTIKTLLNRRSEQFHNFCPLSAEALDKLVTYSDRIFQHAIDNHDEQTTWCLRYSQNRKPKNVSSIASLIHICSDYNAWRDDCHMQAYTAQGVDGMTWEAFTFVNNKEARTAQALFDTLSYRGWTVSEWQTALDTLCNLGWISQAGDLYASTELGKSVQETVETRTDDLFYSAWDALSDEEQVDYIHLLKELNEVCMGMLSE